MGEYMFGETQTMQSSEFFVEICFVFVSMIFVCLCYDSYGK